MLNVSTFGNTADFYAIVHLVPHACQLITVDQDHSSGDTVAKIWRLTGSGGTKQCPSQTPRRKSRTGLNPGTVVATALTSHLFLCVPSTFVASFDWDTLARLCSEPDSRLVERCNHYCLRSTVASVSFLTCFTNLWKTLYKRIVKSGWTGVSPVRHLCSCRHNLFSAFLFTNLYCLTEWEYTPHVFHEITLKKRKNINLIFITKE